MLNVAYEYESKCFFGSQDQVSWDVKKFLPVHQF